MRPEVDVDGIVDFTRRLVRVPSVNRPGQGEAAAVAEVVALARSWGWDPMVEEVAPGRPNCVIRLEGGLPGKTLLFEGHTDVVTPGDPEAWTRDPFGAELAQGRIHGRGAADMKGGLSAMLHAARAIELAGPFPGTLLLAVLCDEEEMMIGVHDFVRRGHARGVAGAIVCEPEGGEVCLTQKGAIRLRIDLEGTMAHGAMPQEGHNPIVAATQIITALTDIERDYRTDPGEHPLLGLTHLTPTHVAAGSLPQLNVIPGNGVLTVDVRTVPGVDHVELMHRVGSAVEQVANSTGVDVTVTVLVDRPATETSPEDPIARAVIDAHVEVAGVDPVIGGVPGTTDGTILWRDAGIPVVVYGPGGKWIAHQADEYVEVDDLVLHARVYAAAALRFLSS
ncbi:MAG TPA: M20 family metallopeptidase [Acidimicrobiia bacterium]|nr:M20 family metallopeptidase [Acidimicrobiia bacterium]